MNLSTPSTRSRRPIAAFCIVAAVLQLVIAPQLALFGGRINFMLVLTAVLAVSGDIRTLAYIGFFAGLFYDLTTVAPIGLMALLLTVAGYLTAALSRGITLGASMESLRMAGVAVLAVNVVYAVALFAMGSETNLLVALGVHGLASTVLDLLVAFLALLFVPQNDAGHGFSGRRSGHMSATLHRGGHRAGTRFKGLR